MKRIITYCLLTLLLACLAALLSSSALRKSS